MILISMKPFKSLCLSLAICLASAGGVLVAHAAEAPKPLKILLITGGCCHDYTKQKDILKQGIEARANAVVEQVHVADTTTKPPLPIHGNPDYAKGFDVVIHDECASQCNAPELIDAVLAPHRAGIPGVNLHCAMHSYRFGNIGKPLPVGAPNGRWYEYLGLHSTAHGAQKPIAITFVDPAHPITRGLENWTTINEELYNNVHVYDTAHPLARGTQDPGGKEGPVVAWTHEYGGKKTRVFSTTIGHNNETVGDARYLNLVTRGVLWAAGRLNDDGTPMDGYAARVK